MLSFHLHLILVVFELGIHKRSIFYIMAINTCVELGIIYKASLILYLSFFLRCTHSRPSELGICTPTPMLYFSSLNCIQDLRLYSSFFLNCALSTFKCIYVG